MAKQNPIFITAIVFAVMAIELFLFSKTILALRPEPVLPIIAFFLVTIISWFGLLFILTLLRVRR